ncbi:MAG TPA: flagellar export chaperone FlgN [Terriglobales bacterium]|nr:flagellar export chaperone FlgN [Terriglobales bacterium]
MDVESQEILALLERRIALLGSLAEALSTASANAVAFDIDGLEARILQQETLCREIQSLDVRLDRMQLHCVNQASLSGASRSIPSSGADSAALRDAARRLQEVQGRVKKLNEAHQALLRRSRRTVGALLCSYHSFAMSTYSNPSATPVLAGEAV